MNLRFALVALALAPCLAHAKLVTKTVPYKYEGRTMQGYLAYDDAVSQQRPGVLVLPEWWGLNDYAKRRTRELAQMGYVAFAADLYGDGKVTRDPKQAQAWSEAAASSGPGRMALALIAKPALDTLRIQPQTDPERLAAVGFCFGGTTALQLAYAGAHLRGVVSVHGGLIAPDADQSRRIRSAVLILHGDEDPFVKAETIDAMVKAFSGVHVDWSMVRYGGAVHAFSNPDANNYRVPGVAYNAKAARRSWETTRGFLAEIFR
jgi:dienelactone hydrolase